MNKWIAEFELEDGDTMPEHMDLEYKGARIDFHCKPLKQEPTTTNDLGVDVVSREAVLDLIADYDLSMGQVVKGIHALPSVTSQEPFKPMVEIDLYSVIKQKYIERDVLDKIRAEIEHKAHSGQWSDATMYGMLKAVAIIDKYKAEIEPQESEDK